MRKTVFPAIDGLMFCRSYSYQQPNNWTSSPGPPSSFETTPFAQSIFQRTAPSSAYPTPPPGITNSSSSLAYALGPPPPPQQPRVYQPQESPAFFNHFLEQKTREMNTASQVPHRPATPPPKAPPPPVEESPDPLALQSYAPVFAAGPVATPRKRKVYVQLDSPSVKRIQSVQSFHNKSTPKLKVSNFPITPSRSNMQTSTPTANVTPTPNRTVNKAYVSIPYKPWLTPSSSRKGASKMGADDTPDDLGGYGSEDEDAIYSPTRIGRNESIKSSARRTGDRDDRGACIMPYHCRVLEILTYLQRPSRNWSPSLRMSLKPKTHFLQTSTRQTCLNSSP